MNFNRASQALVIIGDIFKRDLQPKVRPFVNQRIAQLLVLRVFGNLRRMDISSITIYALDSRPKFRVSHRGIASVRKYLEDFKRLLWREILGTIVSCQLRRDIVALAFSATILEIFFYPLGFF